MPTPWPRSRLSVANSVAGLGLRERRGRLVEDQDARARTASARAISTICCLADAQGRRPGPRDRRSRPGPARRPAAAWANMRRRSTQAQPDGLAAQEEVLGRPRDSAPARAPGGSPGCPAGRPRRRRGSRRGRPSSSIVPASGRTTPPSTLISVDFPAPFSPSRAWISPARSVKSTPSSAATPPNRFVIPRSASRGRSPVGSSGMGLVHWLFRNSSAFSLVISLTGILMSLGTVLPARCS